MKHRQLPQCRCVLAGLAAVFYSLSANAAEEWVTIPTNVPNVAFSIDKGSIQREGKQVRFWEKIVFAKPDVRDQASGEMIKEKKVHRLMNCDNSTQGVIYGATFGENGGFITSTSFDDAKISMSAIPAGTVAYDEFQLVCAAPPDKP